MLGLKLIHVSKRALMYIEPMGCGKKFEDAITVTFLRMMCVDVAKVEFRSFCLSRCYTQIHSLPCLLWTLNSLKLGWRWALCINPLTNKSCMDLKLFIRVLANGLVSNDARPSAGTMREAWAQVLSELSQISRRFKLFPIGSAQSCAGILCFRHGQS